MNQMIDRMKKPTPKFFVKLRNIGLTAGAVGAALLAQPTDLPAIVLKAAEYLTLAGGITSLLSQAAVRNDD